MGLKVRYDSTHGAYPKSPLKIFFTGGGCSNPNIDEEGMVSLKGLSPSRAVHDKVQKYSQ